jgi:20S proteasome subunit beta 4
MDEVFGFVGYDFAVLVADRAATQQIIVQKLDEDKIVELDSTKIMALSGPKGDCVAFGEYLRANVRLYRLKYGHELDVSATAHYARNELAEALRSGPYQVNCLLAGFDKLKNEPELHFMDYLATCHRVNTGGHGYGGMFCLSLFDKHWVPNMSRAQAMDLVDLCVGEVCERLVTAPTDYLVKIVDKNGCETIVYDATDRLKKRRDLMADVAARMASMN